MNSNSILPYIDYEGLGEKKIPFIADFDCCHTHPMFTLPIGCEIELNATEKKISITKD